MIKLIRKIALVVAVVLFGVLVVGTVIANENELMVNQALNVTTFKIDKSDVDPNQDTNYIKSVYDNLDDVVKAGRDKTVEVVEEGCVLLKNDNNTLPLKKNAKVTLIGAGAYDPVYGGTGSGGISTTEATDFHTALTNAGLFVNPKIKEAYTSDEWKQYKRGTGGSFGSTTVLINDAPWSAFDGALSDSIDEYGDAVIMVVSRRGGEGYDLRNNPMVGFEGHDGIDNGDGLGKDYLGLNANEISILEGLKAKKDAGKIKKIIILENYSALLEGNFIKDAKYGVDAAMWVGAPSLGGQGIGNLLVGDAQPSGRLTDTMFLDNAMNPVNVNYAPRLYENAADVDLAATLGNKLYIEYSLAAYTVYQEGMYLGYKYTETRYEDLVLGTANIGAYDYNKVVAYPFGYGMTYADFETSNVSVKKTGDREYTVSVKVTNTSENEASGKYSVPIYISKPYGAYAKENGIQVPSVELIDFVKTSKALQKGESEELTVKLDEKYFASYDAEKAKTYVLMDGDYYVVVGGDAHEATNNLLMAKKANGVGIDESKMVGTGDASKAVKFTLNYSSDKYAFSDNVSSFTGTKGMRITNLFDFADINRYEGKGDNRVEYYSRDAWNKVSLDMVNGYAKVRATEKLARDIYAQVPDETGVYNNTPSVPDKYKQPIPKDNREYPTMGADNGLSLIDLRVDSEGNPISYFDPVWDKLLDQLTWEEMALLPTKGQRTTEALASVNKPGTRHDNGPNGFSTTYLSNNVNGLAYLKEVEAGHVDENGNITAEANKHLQGGRNATKTTGYPSNATLAGSFNKQLAREVGDLIGEDGLWSGRQGLFGLGMNIHRSSYLGRTCEYYSEDGMLTGIIGAHETAGIESKGVHVYNKHCALNDQEFNRHGVACWIPEQALREIYLRAFELPITMGGGTGTMASFSRFGPYSGAACRALGTDFLKGECGMLGLIVTDYYGDMNGNQNIDPYFEQVYGNYIGGCDLCDGNQPSTGNHFAKYKDGYGEMAWALRDSAKRFLYYTLTSSAMNGMASGARIIQLTPWWKTLLLTFDIIFGIIVVGLAAWAVVDYVFEFKKRGTLR